MNQRGFDPWVRKNRITIAKGANAVHGRAITKEKQGMVSVYEDSPFQPESDLLCPNESYWRYLDEIVATIEEQGFLLCLSAVWLGYYDVGWQKMLTRDNAGAYGQSLDSCYRSHDDPVCILGDDIDQTNRGTRTSQPPSGNSKGEEAEQR
jgi:hypothetical protein